MDVVIVNVYHYREDDYFKTPSLYEFTVEEKGKWRDTVEDIVSQKFDRSKHFVTYHYVKHSKSQAAA